MDKGKFFAGLAVMAGLMFFGIMFRGAVNDNREYDRVVSVKGLSEKEVEADKVFWPIVFNTMSNDLVSLNEQLEKGRSQIMSFLRDGGVKEEEISVSMPEISDKYAAQYGENDRTYRFVAKNVITVCSENVEQVRALMAKQDVLLKKGLVISPNDWENRVEFKFEGLNEVKPQMIEEATRNAREAAQKFAQDSDSRLGKIKTANQGVFSIEDRDRNTPYIKVVRVVTSVTYYLEN